MPLSSRSWLMTTFLFELGDLQIRPSVGCLRVGRAGREEESGYQWVIRHFENFPLQEVNCWHC